jgi:N-acetylglutamate synthase-like GNAT family acetyltransferase
MDTPAPPSFAELDRARQQGLSVAANDLCVAEFGLPLYWTNDYHVYAAVQGNGVIGAANVCISPDTRVAYIRYMAVDPACRNRRIGSMMMGVVMAEIESARCDEVWLMPLTKESARFFGRHGFSTLGELRMHRILTS